jgi:hypothetical protein
MEVQLEDTRVVGKFPYLKFQVVGQSSRHQHGSDRGGFYDMTFLLLSKQHMTSVPLLANTAFLFLGVFLMLREFLMSSSRPKIRNRRISLCFMVNINKWGQVSYHRINILQLMNCDPF